MEKQLLIATTNEFKAKGLKEAWDCANLEDYASLITFDDLGIKDRIDVAEDTGSIEGDALKKAVEYSRFLKRPVICVDQGFGLDALYGWPGPATKKVMAGDENLILGREILETNFTKTDDVGRARLILSNLEGLCRTMTCYYAVSIVFPSGKSSVGVHQVNGQATKELYVGRGWFYDWFFIPEGYDIPLSQFDRGEFERFEREEMYQIPEEISDFIKEVRF